MKLSAFFADFENRNCPQCRITLTDFADQFSIIIEPCDKHADEFESWVRKHRREFQQ